MSTWPCRNRVELLEYLDTLYMDSWLKRTPVAILFAGMGPSSVSIQENLLVSCLRYKHNIRQSHSELVVMIVNCKNRFWLCYKIGDDCQPRSGEEPEGEQKQKCPWNIMWISPSPHKRRSAGASTHSPILGNLNCRAPGRRLAFEVALITRWRLRRNHEITIFPLKNWTERWVGWGAVYSLTLLGRWKRRRKKNVMESQEEWKPFREVGNKMSI